MLNSGKYQFMIKPAIAGSLILAAPVIFISYNKNNLTETVEFVFEIHKEK